MDEENELTFEKQGHIYDRRNLFIIKDKVYDLTDWINKHPGGSHWFQNSGSRDISVAVYGYHKDPVKLERILKRYEVDIEAREIENPFLNVPEFLIPENFDIDKDILRYNWDDPKGFLKVLQSPMRTPKMQAKLKRADFLFDLVAALILIAHVLMMFVGVPNAILPLWGFVLFFTLSRTALAAVGHYHCHRKKNGISDWGDSLFDMQYVGFSIILFNGHVMGHHMYTNSSIDVKRTVFTGMLELPRLFRVPVMTLQKFGQFLTGYFIRWHQLFQVDKSARVPLKFYQLLFVRLLLLSEFVFCMVSGYWLLWILQFTASIWFNLFLIVSSHDFEEPETNADLSHGQDWGVFQIDNSFDMSVVGNGYIDCFLTAGLGTHRTHHVLPGQKSGFSNIISNKVVRATWEEFGKEWTRTRNFLLERFPKLFVHYMFAPVKRRRHDQGSDSRNSPENPYVINPETTPSNHKEPSGFFAENFSLSALKVMYQFIYVGFKGEGSI